MPRVSKKHFESQIDAVFDCINTGVIDEYDFKIGFEEGYRWALKQFGIWKDGVQVIGCLETPIKEILDDLGIK